MSRYFDIYKDFPKKGIEFKDYTKMYKNGTYTKVLEHKITNIDYIAPIEARGFLMAGAFWGVPIIPIRKAGKLPGKVISETYNLEYGTATLEMQKMNLRGKSVLILDDVLATGGTINATVELLKKCGAKRISALVLEDIGICDHKDINVQSLFIKTCK